MTEYILFVDDEKLIKRLVSHYFRNQISQGEYEFIFAYNGMEALEKLEEQPRINLVITDINMPEMDGLTLIGKIREAHQNIKTIIISAYEDLKIIRQAMNLGVCDFINKPIDFHDLETTIRRTLDDLRKLKPVKLAYALNESDSCINQLVTSTVDQRNNSGNRIDYHVQEAQAVIKEVIHNLIVHQQKLTEISVNNLQNYQELDSEALLVEVSKILASMKVGMERFEDINNIVTGR
ncbi:MAG TPA: response regulator [Trichormus sp. M33_DOE_039]|nr:response regulator [Trichormus sp. M33_DOE_039]